MGLLAFAFLAISLSLALIKTLIYFLNSVQNLLMIFDHSWCPI
jgi:hypothetical protein